MQDLTALILEVREYAKWFSHAVVKMHVNGTQIPKPPSVSPATSELIHSWGAQQQLNQKSLDALIETLATFKASAQTMTITLAAPAPNDLKERLVEWCRKNIAPEVLVTFKFNATLLGGMVVRYGSHVFDWSFRRDILAAREKFPEVLRSV
ncbi:MAG TPA: F0F1 ATP synthase subunit delta [Candidatus Saccharimonadales bacterium]|nr:F0F1 ATP synthase subunit delta [Candidatus Saccharimonadales bacterium]